MMPSSPGKSRIARVEIELATAAEHEQPFRDRYASLTEQFATSDLIPVEPDGPRRSRSQIEAKLRDCLRQLRAVRLDRTRQTPDSEGDPAEADTLAALDRQEALRFEQALINSEGPSLQDMPRSRNLLVPETTTASP